MDHFFGSNATVRALVNGAYPLSNYPNATVQSSMMIRDYFFLCPTSRANLALAALGRNTFLYQNRFLDLTYCTNPTAGVYHSAELQYVWGNGRNNYNKQQKRSRHDMQRQHHRTAVAASLCSTFLLWRCATHTPLMLVGWSVGLFVLFVVCCVC